MIGQLKPHFQIAHFHDLEGWTPLTLVFPLDTVQGERIWKELPDSRLTPISTDSSMAAMPAAQAQNSLLRTKARQKREQELRILELVGIMDSLCYSYLTTLFSGPALQQFEAAATDLNVRYKSRTGP